MPATVGDAACAHEQMGEAAPRVQVARRVLGDHACHGKEVHSECQLEGQPQGAVPREGHAL